MPQPLRRLALTVLVGLSGAAVVNGQSASSPETAKAAKAFHAQCAARAKAAEKKYEMTVRGQGGWMFFAGELRHIGAGQFWGSPAAKASQAVMAHNADPLPAILDFKAQLDKAGIELLLVPVPPKAIIYPEALSPALAAPGGAPQRLDPFHREFYDVLKANGVEVLDLVPEFLSHKADAAGPVYCRQDTHWSGRASVLASRRIAELVKARPWFGAIAKTRFEAEWKRIPLSGDLWLGLTQAQPPRETLPLRFVGTRARGVKAQAGLKPAPTNPKSPVVLLGDSHALVFHAGGDMHARGAGLADQLALDLGFAPDVVAVRGSGATPARSNLMRRARADAGYLGKKKLVIWCFSAREFTETMGWQKVPVVR